MRRRAIMHDNDTALREACTTSPGNVATYQTVAEPRSIAQAADLAYEAIRIAIKRGADEFPELNAFEESICLKNAHGVVVFSNEAHRKEFSPNASPIGRTAHAYLDPMMAERAEVFQTLILGGCPYVECEHSGLGPDGSVYRMVVHKKSLQDLAAPGLAILAVVRVLSRDASGESAANRLDLSASSAEFRELSDRDQEICRLTALGVSSRELGERLGMTTRGIELRKQKAFAHLGTAKAVDLARLLVRLQDRGYLDLGL